MHSIIPPSAVGLLSETQGDARYPGMVDSLASLRSRAAPSGAQRVLVAGHSSAFDGGYREVRWDPSLTAQSFSATAADDTFTATAHVFLQGEPVLLYGASLPAGVSAATTYYITAVTTNTFKLATSVANAIAGTAINITADGSGSVNYADSGLYAVPSSNPQDGRWKTRVVNGRLNARWWGAVPDNDATVGSGSGTDSTEAINAALISAYRRRLNEAVDIPIGITPSLGYKLTNTIWLYSGSTILATGGVNTGAAPNLFYYGPDSTHAIDLDHVQVALPSRYHLEGFRLTDKRTNPARTGKGLNFDNYTNHVILKGIQVQGFYDNIYIGDSTGATTGDMSRLEGIWSLDALRYQINVERLANDHVWTDIRMGNPGAVASTGGIRIGSGAGATLTITGVKSEAGTTSYPTIVVDHNRCPATTLIGVTLANGGGASDVVRLNATPTRKLRLINITAGYGAATNLLNETVQGYTIPASAAADGTALRTITDWDTGKVLPQVRDGSAGNSGNAAVTLGTYDREYQILTEPLNANRTLTLPSSSDLQFGTTFVFRRDAVATGNFSWNIATNTGTTLASLQPGEWARVMYTGQAQTYDATKWMLAQQGSANAGAATLVIPLNDFSNSTAATDLAAGVFNAVGDQNYRNMADVRNYTSVQLWARLAGTVATATKVRVQYHTGGSPAISGADGGWTDLITSAGSHTTGVTFVTSAITLPVGARISNLLLRPGIYDGDGVADPVLQKAVLIFS